MFLVGGNYGHDLPWPKRLAYQHVSEVIECGEAITQFKPGDIIFSSTFPGHVEFHLLRESDLVIRLPEGFDLISAAQLGVASVSYHDAVRAGVNTDDNVLVVGDGLIGQFAAQAARVMGAHVTVAGHHGERLRIARELGADMVINNSDEAGKVAVRQQSPYSVIFECCGGEILDEIIGVPGKPGLVEHRSRARLVLVAGRYEVSYNFNMAGMAELEIIHTQHFDQEDLEQVVFLITKGEIRIRPLIRDIVPLAEAVRIFDTMRDNPGTLQGPVIVMPGTY
jgi:2-desacetyl-2-hydroxyethyl bacteriochlorophyllide A dehydrogenase